MSSFGLAISKSQKKISSFTLLNHLRRELRATHTDVSEEHTGLHFQVIKNGPT